LRLGRRELRLDQRELLATIIDDVIAVVRGQQEQGADRAEHGRGRPARRTGCHGAQAKEGAVEGVEPDERLVVVAARILADRQVRVRPVERQ